MSNVITHHKYILTFVSQYVLIQWPLKQAEQCDLWSFVIITSRDEGKSATLTPWQFLWWFQGRSWKFQLYWVPSFCEKKERKIHICASCYKITVMHPFVLTCIKVIIIIKKKGRSTCVTVFTCIYIYIYIHATPFLQASFRMHLCQRSNQHQL